MRSSGSSPFSRSLLILALFLTGISAAWAQSTGTTLNITTNIAGMGTAVTLSAAVTSGGAPVSAGLVVFCDADAVRCADSAVLGSSWITKSGTATLRKTFGLGTHNIHAVYQGTKSYAASNSSTQVLTVTGPGLATTSTISSTGVSGNYVLTGTITTNSATAPTGSISFLDASNGNYPVAAAVLGTATVTSSFTSKSGPAAVTGNQAIATGDFNNDGKLDYVVTSLISPSSATIMLGNGDGTFTKGASYATGASPEAVVAADLNGDGNLDLAFANSSSTGVVILLGNGDGTFTTAAIPALGWAASVAVGDFNGDGIPDLAVGNSGFGYAVTILLGNGDGTFTVGASVPVTQWSIAPQGLLAMDLNGDGKTDLAVTSSNGNTGNYAVTILLSNGDGTFTQGQSYTTGASDLSIAGGDFNGDGIPDLAIANYASSTLTILLGNGDGTFTAAAPVSIGAGAFAIVAADINRDGKLDLAIANYTRSVVTLLLGNGDGTFTATTSSPTAGPNPAGIVAGDFNGDGLLDFITANYYASTTSILLQSAKLTINAIANGVAVPGSGGTHNVLASYGGDNTYASSQSGTIALGSTQVGSSVTLTVLPGSPVAGNSTTLQVSIPASLVGGLSPSGTVQFNDGSNYIGTGTVSGGQAVILHVFPITGVHSLQAVYSGDANFKPSTSAINTVTVVPGAPTMTCTPQGASTVTYGSYGSNPMITVLLQGTSGAIPGGSVSMYLDSNSSPIETDPLSYYNSTTGYVNAGNEYWTVINGGAHTFTLKYSGDSNWAPASCSVPITVLKDAPQLVGSVYSSINPSSTGTQTVIGANFRDPLGCRTYCTAPSGTVTFYSDGSAIGTVPVTTTSWSAGYFSGSLPISNLPAGTHTITGSYSGDANYATVAAGGAFTQTVNNALGTQTISFAVLPNVTYGASPMTLSGTASSGLPVSYTVTGPAAVSGNTLTITGVGAVTVTANQAGNGSFAAASPVAQSFTVSKVMLMVIANNVTIAYGQSIPSLGYTLTGFVNSDTIAVVAGPVTEATAATSTSPAGTYPISFATQGLTATNYTFNYVGGTLTVVGGAAQTISFGALPNVTYGVSSLTLSATASSGLPVSYAVSGPATMSGNALTITGAGAVTVTANQAGNANYAAAAPVSQSFTVNKAGLTVAANNASMVYGQAMPDFSYIVSGFVNGDTSAVVAGSATEATTATSTSPAGTYPISFANQGLTATNYTFNYVNGTLTIAGGAAQTISFGTLPNVTYGAGPITLSATSSSGLQVSYAVSGPATVSGNTLTIAGAGTVTVTATQPGNANYGSATPVSQSFTVNKAGLTVAARNASIVYGQALPSFSYVVSGFVNSDTSAVVAGSATETTTATSTSPAGTYPISFANQGLTATNYTFNYVNGTLTIAGGAAQTISFGTLPNVTYGAGPITLSATSSSGLQVSYAVSGPATVSGNTLTITGAGTVTVTATQPGNANYGSATPVSQSFTVGKASTSISNISYSANNPTKAPVNLGVTVIVTPQISGTPTGTVNVTAVLQGASATVQCTLTLAGGSGTCAVPLNSKGFYTITATYLGDSNFNSSPAQNGVSFHAN